MSDGAIGAIAIGYDWQNGFRGDVALLGMTSQTFSGLCASASDGTPCADHTDITHGSLSTTALMANLFWSPLEQFGSNSVFQPFVVVGVGVAQNSMGSWTRVNDRVTPPVSEPTRVFSGNTNSDVAWSFGLGASMQLSRPGKWPVILEGAWRYYDFGSAVGGSVADVGGSTPRQPLTFRNTSHVFTLGIRVPLQRL